jgi:addiction module RelE/StbE family toxin
MEVLWLEGAITDLEEIYAYIAARNPSVAPRVAETLLDSAARLAAHPRLGRSGRIDGTRELVVPRLPFVIVYRVLEQNVEVLRVIHGRRDWHTAFGERT